MSPPFPSHPAAQFVRGPNFSYLLPHGWSVGEEGNYSLVLRSPDFRAGIIVFGQSGLLCPMSPEQFAQQAMSGVMRLAPDVRLASARPLPPMPGCTHAALMDVTYTLQGPMGWLPIRGVVFSHVAVGYGQCSGVITLAGADVQQWESYRPWLPQVASAAVNTGPNPYGSAAMAQAMHGITQREQSAHTAYRQWSEATWSAVAADRAAAQARQQAAMDPMLAGREWLNDPYGNPAERRSIVPAAIWVSRDGREASSDDPSFDPRTPGDVDWRRVR